ncbi:hypothetical protein U6G28_04590 [Actinomycetaceae bacterium MB13-C1-2]|nr:hypothetical protein U6G28_04590 [Actinomycetaceae bacterium MB13-C1-2]
MITAIKDWWHRFEEKHPEWAKFLMFFIFSNGVTLLQLMLMPIFQSWFNGTSLVNIAAQWFPIGSDVDGSQYYIFNYAAGPVQPDGYGGGLAYFLAVQITLLIAQVINFFLQRNITFKSNTNPWIAAMWYLIAYVVITFAAGALQGFYKAPIYHFFMTYLGWASTGRVVADVITMIINSALSFWVFYPIFRVIFKQKPEEEADEDSDDSVLAKA